MNDVIPDQRGLCQHCGMWAYWDGRRWRHELNRSAACPNGRTSATVDGKPLGVPEGQAVTRLPCCSTWDGNTLIHETTTMRAVLDGHPVAPGHALVYPIRHVDRLVDLTGQEVIDALYLIEVAQHAADVHEAEDFTIAVNDGPLAGRTVPHLHVHVIPRRAGDVPDPRGGVRRLLVPDMTQDPWITREGS